MMTSNAETRKELEQRGQTAHEAYAKLGRENVYLETLLPKTLDRDAIRKELEPIAAELKAAKSDGQATGLAVKHLKQKGLAVLGEDVAAAVKQLAGSGVRRCSSPWPGCRGRARARWRRLAAELGAVVLARTTVRAALFPPPVLDYSAGQDNVCMAAI